MGKRLVNEALISQDGQRLSLTLVVRVETTQDNAQEWRVTISSDWSKHLDRNHYQAEKLGRGFLITSITVTYADGTRIAQGAKDSTDITIAW